jgi:iron(III) transport system permease protein
VLALGPAAYLLAQAAAALAQGGWLVHFVSTTLPRQALTSALLAAEAAVVAFAVGAVPAVIVSRWRVPGRDVIAALALLPLLFSPSVTASLWSVRWSQEWLTSRQALAMHQGLACAPYLFVVFRLAASRTPAAFGELAAALGQGRAARLARVHLPLLAVPAAAGLMIVFAQSVGDYAAAERLGIDTLSTGIHTLWFASQSSQVAAVVTTVLVLPALALLAVAAWAATALISQNPVPPATAAAAQRPLLRAGVLALWAWCLGWAVPGFVVPEVLLVQWTVARWQRTRFADIPGDLASSLLTALGTVALVLALCAAIVLLMRAGHRARWAERVPWLFLANWFLPSLVLALAFVLMSRDGAWLAGLLGPWRDSRVLVVVAEALRFMPLAVLPALDALRRTPPAMIEAARAFGASPLRARAVAFAGHLLPALALGAALVFVESVKELELGLTLQPFGYSSLPLKVYAFSRNQNLDRAAVWVLLSQALLLLPLAGLWWRLRRLDAAR